MHLEGTTVFSEVCTWKGHFFKCEIELIYAEPGASWNFISET